MTCAEERAFGLCPAGAIIDAFGVMYVQVAQGGATFLTTELVKGKVLQIRPK